MKRCEHCGAEHYEDSELPVTEEWLRSVGFVSDQLGEELLSPVGFGLSRLGVTDFGWHYGLEGDRFHVAHVPTPATRGDSRRLCKALRIELKDEGAG